MRRRRPLVPLRRRRPFLPPAPIAAGLLWMATSRRRPVVPLRGRRPFFPPAPIAAGLLWMATSRRRPVVARRRQRPPLSPVPTGAGLLWVPTGRRRPLVARRRERPSTARRRRRRTRRAPRKVAGTGAPCEHCEMLLVSPMLVPPPLRVAVTVGFAGHSGREGIAAALKETGRGSEGGKRKRHRCAHGTPPATTQHRRRTRAKTHTRVVGGCGNKQGRGSAAGVPRWRQARDKLNGTR